MQPITASRTLLTSHVELMTLDDLEHFLTRSRAFAWALIVGLPVLGIMASLLADLPLFAALMSGSFLLATALVCRKALARFTGRTLRLLVAARLVIILVVGALLFCVTGAAWAGIVSTLLLWLTAERLLGRYALNNLGRLARHRPAPQALIPAVMENANSHCTRTTPALPEDELADDSSAVGTESRLFPPVEMPIAEPAQPRRRRRCKA